MIGLLAVACVLLLVVVLLPVFNGIGSYKKTLLKDMPELQERERRKRERQLNKKKKQPIDDGSYRPRAWDEEEPEQRSFASGLKSTVSSVLPRNKLKFSPSDVPTDTAQRQNPNVGTYVNPETPYSSHIDNNFDVDQFIAEEAKKDRQEKSAEAEQEAKYNYKDLDTII